MKARRIPLLVVFVAFSLATAAQAQFSINWFTIDGGGGTSAGGPFSVSGAIGQPDASPTPLAGNGFNVTGGFWSFRSTPPPSAPSPLLLHIALISGGQIKVSAQAAPGATATVEATTDLGNPNGWVNLSTVSANGAGLMSFIDTDITNYPMRFYRFVNTTNLNTQ